LKQEHSQIFATELEAYSPIFSWMNLTALDPIQLLPPLPHFNKEDLDDISRIAANWNKKKEDGFNKQVGQIENIIQFVNNPFNFLKQEDS
jgi:hypothetical protein